MNGWKAKASERAIDKQLLHYVVLPTNPGLGIKYINYVYKKVFNQNVG